MSLTTCLKKAGTAVKDEGRRQLIERARQLRGEGLSASEAAQRALDEQIEQVAAALGLPPEPELPALSQSPFISALQRGVEGLPMKVGAPSAWQQTIRGLVAAGKVKADEVEWSGVNEWLDAQQGKVMKSAVLEFLAGNGVQVQETTLRDASVSRDIQVIEANGFRVNADEFDGPQLMRPGTWAWDAVDADDTTVPAEVRAAMDNLARGADGTPTKYGQYILPGGTNYREILLTLPRKGGEPEEGSDLPSMRRGRAQADREAGNYRSSHWDQPNILAHIRVNERTDADGKRVLFVEEIQSDWAQEGKKKGFADPNKGWHAKKDENGRWDVYNDGEYQATVDAGSEDAAISMMLGQRTGIPRAPFIDSTDKWVALALKRIIKLAVDDGYDRVAFVTGEQSADRYDLSKQVDQITYEDGVLRAFQKRTNVITKKATPEELPDLIGKEVAQRLLDAPLEDGRRVLMGESLKVGGGGMRAFYDKIVPTVAKDVLRKLGGGGLTQIDLGTSVAGRVQDRENPDYAPLLQPAFDITDAMRERAAGGLPLFVKKAPAAPRAVVPQRVQARRGLDPQRVQDMVDRVTSSWSEPSATVTVVGTATDLPSGILASLRAMNAVHNTRGLMMPDGRMFLVADQLESIDEAQFVLFHEAYGHFGLRAFLGDSYERQMGMLRVANPTLAAEANQWYAQFGQGAINARVKAGMAPDEAGRVVRLLAVEEALANRAGRGDVPKGWQRLMARLQALLRRMGLDRVADFLERMTEAQTLALLADARRAVTGSRTHYFTEPMPQPNLSQKLPDDPVLREAMRRAGTLDERTLASRVRDGLYGAHDAYRQKGELWDQFRGGALDRMYGIQRAQERYLDDLPAEQNHYITARLANGGTAPVMHALLMHGQARWNASGQHLEKIPGTKGLLDILSPLGDDLNLWFSWMVGNRAARLMGEGRENNLTAEQIKALQDLGTPERLPKFRRAAKEYAAFKRSVLDVAQQSGLIDPEGRKAWDFADYIPFYRQIDEKAVFSPTGRDGLAGQSSGIRRLKGSTAAINDPVENLLMNFSRLIDASLKNNAIVKTIRQLEKVKDLEVVKKVGYDVKPALVLSKEVMRVLEENGTSPDVLATIPTEVFEGISKMWAIQAPSDPDVVRIMVGGRPQYYRVTDPLLLRAFTSFVPFDFPGLGLARAAKRILTAGVTATPEFWVRNWIRDSVSAQAIAREGFNPGMSIKGIAKSYNEGSTFEKLLFAGASFESGNTNAGDPEGTAIQVRRALRRRGMSASSISGFMATVVDSPARFWDGYRRVGDAVENANREAVYFAALKAGKSEVEAAYEAKDLMDFSLRGYWAGYQIMADVLPFFNARVQGLYRLGRADPRRLALVGGMLMLASTILAFINDGEEWYEQLPDWDKDTFWHMRIFGEHFRIPKPFEVGVIFATLPERIGRAIKGLDSGKKSWEVLKSNLSQQLAFDPVPQLIRPAIDVIYNWDSFLQRPIENVADEGLLPRARAGATTSDTLKLLADVAPETVDATGLSPKKMESLIGGYFGTLGLYALGAADFAVRLAQDGPERPDLRPDDLPLVRTFYRVDPARATVYESDLYKMRQELEQVMRTARRYGMDGNAEKMGELVADKQSKLEAYGIVTGTVEGLSAMTKQRDRIYKDPNMTPEQKRRALDELQVMRNELARRAAADPRVKEAF